MRNVRVYGRFVLVASEGGVTFWTGNHPLAAAKATSPPTWRSSEAELALRRGIPASPRSSWSRSTTATRSRGSPRNPGAGWLLERAKRSTRSCRSARRMRYTRRGIGSRRSCRICCVLPSPFAGAIRLVAQRAPPDAAVSAGGSAVLVCLVFFPQERFRIPVIDPALIVAAAAMLAGRGRERDTARPRRRPDVQRTRQPAAARARRPRARRLPPAGRRRRLARRHRRDRRRARRRASRPRRGHAPHRPARARPLVHRRPAPRHQRQPTPTSSARWTPTSRTTRSTCRRSPRRRQTTTSSSARATCTASAS